MSLWSDLLLGLRHFQAHAIVDRIRQVETRRDVGRKEGREKKRKRIGMRYERGLESRLMQDRCLPYPKEMSA